MASLARSNSSRKEAIAEDLDVENGTATSRLYNSSPVRSRARLFRKRSGQNGATNPTKARCRKRRGILSRKKFEFNFGDKDVENIFNVAQHHKEYTVGATTIKELAMFDDCRDYGVNETEHEQLVRAEIRKLLEAAARHGPFLFNSHGDLHPVDKNGFDDVSNLMDQIHCNFAIVSHDNARIGLEHCPSLMEDMVRDFKKSRRQLIGRYKDDEDRIKGTLPKILQDNNRGEQRNRKLYHAMVDYILGSIARILVRTAKSEFWLNNTFAILAQWAVKLKILAYEPAKNAEISLSNGEDMIEQVVGDAQNKKAFVLKVRFGQEDREREVDTLNTESDISELYFEENLLFRDRLCQLVREAIFTMYDGTKLGKRNLQGPECFETCNLVYRTGLEGVPTTINSDRYGNMGTSSEPLHISCIYGALLLLLDNVEELQRNAENSKDIVADRGALAQWEWSEEETRKKISGLRLSRMDDVISVTIAQCLGTTYSAMCLDSLIRHASTGTMDEDPVMLFRPPHKSFQVIFTFQTEEFTIKRSRQPFDQYHDPEVRSLSESPLKGGVRAGTSLMLSSSAQSSSEAEAKSRAMLEQYAKHKREMDTWVVFEDSITVRCRRYVVTVICIAALIVCGGMAIPFIVRNKIRGVDPFQITTFSWIATGFLVALAKSRYVSEWPWHRFIRGEVVCRGVNDISDVTGIDPQTILMNLLHEEENGILITRGPYNGMFGRKTTETGSGFSIDSPVHLSTMLASGFVVLKVINELGEHLICEDVRKGAPARSIPSGGDQEYISYMDIGKDAVGDEPDEMDEMNEKHSMGKAAEAASQKVLRLSMKKFTWKKIAGLYIHDSKFG
ncbi:MAG: hypothetical protein M1839_006537 [Geoglossum umbratile]|nr:MAG: hypothetical protein M1839_006537 [Geoglossum umbratile]